jgi:hypothetical protein
MPSLATKMKRGLMNRTRTRIASASVSVAAFVLCLALAATAFGAGVPGDSVANATSLNSYIGSSLTTDLIPGTLGVTGHYYLRIYLSAGRTFKAAFKPDADIVTPNAKALVLPLKSSYRIIESSADASGVARLSFMAPVSGMYNVYFGPSYIGTFTVSPSYASATKYSLSSFTAPSTAKKGRSYKLSLTLKPGYNGPVSPIKYVIQRRVSGHWKSYSTVSSSYASGSSTYSRFTRAVKFSKTGTYRVRARFDDAARPVAYTSYKTIKVVN